MVNIFKKPSWKLPESDATPEHAFLNRRNLIKAAGLGAVAAGGFGLYKTMTPYDPSSADPSSDVIETVNISNLPNADLYPFPRNDAYQLDRELTPEKVNLTYNNFYEFGSHKSIARAAQSLVIDPWDIRIDGLVEAEQTISFDDLIRQMPLEERLYRHRCVEAWSMTIPWGGFALSALIDFAKPLSSAKYVRFETFHDPDMASGQKQTWNPWPYVEGLTMAEARNELSFMVTGAYGKPMAKQFGAPLRLALPWKYGFKSIKSIKRISFVSERPLSFWETINASEYGFWANVNPDVPHKRWSQATERVLHTDERVPTLLFNGYGEQVAHLYKDLQNERLYA